MGDRVIDHFALAAYWGPSGSLSLCTFLANYSQKWFMNKFKEVRHLQNDKIENTGSVNALISQ